jgi:SAM-dependent methyltransferase
MHLAAAIAPVAASTEPDFCATDAGRLPPEIRLRCPRCASAPGNGECAACGFVVGIRCGIVRALPPEAGARLAGFIDAYERIREAEGRGSDSGQYYLGLPYHDSSGRERGQWRMRARTLDHAVRFLLPRPAADAPVGVLDLGAGNGWMSYRLALAGFRPCAVDLLTNDSDGMGAARHYRARLPALFPRFQASFESLPFADGQFDAAVFNASFHYSEDAGAALREALRCVKRGGLVVIGDTPWYPRESDGHRMLAERRDAFRRRYGMDGDAIDMLGFLTDARLHALERAMQVRWEVHRPWYGLAWALRPLAARLRGARTPSRFRLYVARKP